MAKCCGKCTLTDGCRIFVDMVNAEDGLTLSFELLETLIGWYDKRSPSFKARANPKMWKNARERLKELQG